MFCCAALTIRSNMRASWPNCCAAFPAKSTRFLSTRILAASFSDRATKASRVFKMFFMMQACRSTCAVRAVTIFKPLVGSCRERRWGRSDIASAAPRLPFHETCGHRCDRRQRSLPNAAARGSARDGDQNSLRQDVRPAHSRSAGRCRSHIFAAPRQRPSLVTDGDQFSRQHFCVEKIGRRTHYFSERRWQLARRDCTRPLGGAGSVYRSHHTTAEHVLRPVSGLPREFGESLLQRLIESARHGSAARRGRGPLGWDICVHGRTAVFHPSGVASLSSLGRARGRYDQSPGSQARPGGGNLFWYAG